eukprot:scaffold62365_cov44-Cyclotella_meneghiniana.AAC.16
MISAKTLAGLGGTFVRQCPAPGHAQKEHGAHSQQCSQHTTQTANSPTMKSAMDEIQSSTKNLTVDATSTDNNADDSKSSASSATTQPEFINTGLHQWESIRSDWLASCHPPSSSSNNKKKQQHAQNIDVDEVIDLIVSNRWRQTLEGVSGGGNNSGSSSLDTARNATKRREDACFDNPVGLPQMVDVLVDLWEAEGLDI